MASEPWRIAGDDLIVEVRLTPRAHRDRIDGRETLADGRSVVAARVRAVPEKGKANAALRALFAEALGLAPSAVSVVAGASARLKTLAMRGDAERLQLQLRKLVGPG